MAQITEVRTFAPDVSAEYPDQRYFPGGTSDNWVTIRDEGFANYTESRVYRSARADLAQVRIHVAVTSIRASAEATAYMNPEQLRDFAQRLLDAAADIEQHPAVSLCPPTVKTEPETVEA